MTPDHASCCKKLWCKVLVIVTGHWSRIQWVSPANFTSESRLTEFGFLKIIASAPGINRNLSYIYSSPLSKFSKDIARGKHCEKVAGFFRQCQWFQQWTRKPQPEAPKNRLDSEVVLNCNFIIILCVHHNIVECRGTFVHDTTKKDFTTSPQNLTSPKVTDEYIEIHGNINLKNSCICHNSVQQYIETQTTE